MSALFKRGYCWVCGAPLFRLVGTQIRYSHYCSRECRIKMAGFEEFTELRFILINSRWAGGPGMREEPLEDYLRSRMCEAVRRLPDSADELAELLIEILRGCSC